MLNITAWAKRVPVTIKYRPSGPGSTAVVNLENRLAGWLAGHLNRMMYRHVLRQIIELILLVMDHKRGKHEKEENNTYTVLVLLPLVLLMIDQVTSLIEQNVTACILNGRSKISNELRATYLVLVT